MIHELHGIIGARDNSHMLYLSYQNLSKFNKYRYFLQMTGAPPIFPEGTLKQNSEGECFAPLYNYSYPWKYALIVNITHVSITINMVTCYIYIYIYMYMCVCLFFIYVHVCACARAYRARKNGVSRHTKSRAPVVIRRHAGTMTRPNTIALPC